MQRDTFWRLAVTVLLVAVMAIGPAIPASTFWASSGFPDGTRVAVASVAAQDDDND